MIKPSQTSFLCQRNLSYGKTVNNHFIEVIKLAITVTEISQSVLCGKNFGGRSVVVAPLAFQKGNEMGLDFS